MKLSGYATFDFSSIPADGQTDLTDFLQSSIDAGNILNLPPGVFLTRPLTLKPGTYIQGAGAGTFTTLSDPKNMTILKPVPDVNETLLVGPPGTSDVKIQDIQLDGTGNSAGGGIALADGVSEEAQWKIDRVYVHHFPASGIYIGDQRRAVQLTSCVVVNNGDHGIIVNGSDAVIDKCAVGLNQGDGIAIIDSASRIANCSIFWNRSGISVGQSVSCVMVGNCIDRNYQHGIYLSDLGYGVSIASNILLSNSQEEEGKYSHIRVDGTQHVAILGNIFVEPASDAQNKADYCIWMRPDASVSGMITNVMHPNASLYGLTNLPPEDW